MVTVSCFKSPPWGDTLECKLMSSFNSPLRYTIPWWGPSAASSSLEIGQAIIHCKVLVYLPERGDSEEQRLKSTDQGIHEDTNWYRTLGSDIKAVSGTNGLRYDFGEAKFIILTWLDRGKEPRGRIIQSLTWQWAQWTRQRLRHRRQGPHQKWREVFH